MRKIKEVLRLRFESKMALGEIARCLGLSKTAVWGYVDRAEKAGLSWPLPQDFDDGQLEAKLFVAPPAVGVRRVEPDFARMHQELKRVGVTLQLLWQEYVAAHGEHCTLRYSQYCEKYRRFARRLKPSMRQIHRAGEKLFIDYSGKRPEVVDAETGEIKAVELFVAVQGASKYTFAEVTWTQQLPDWISSHVRAFEAFGGVNEILVPDNLKSAIKAACRYEPEANSTYADMARHYNAVVIPARPRKPTDKALAEAGVLLVQRWVLARLRNRRFFSLHELNLAIGELVVELNERAFKKLVGSRRTAFETIDRPALRPLPAQPYEFAAWTLVRVGINYHVEFERHFYSVPFTLLQQRLDLRATAHTVECFFKGKRVAAHLRSRVPDDYTTVDEHMPESHRRHRNWSPQRLLAWALTIGPATGRVVDWQMANRPHPEQGYRACLGLLAESRKVGDARLEAACRRALAVGGDPTLKRIRSILSTRLDQLPELFDTAAEPLTASLHHANVRGADYYRTTFSEDTEPCSTNPRSMH